MDLDEAWPQTHRRHGADGGVEPFRVADLERRTVPRRQRRQGLGLALLHHAFSSFHKRGLKKAGLGVDTQNLSGATRLYTKAGMHVTHEFAIYEKELRAGEELSKQAGDQPV